MEVNILPSSKWSSETYLFSALVGAIFTQSIVNGWENIIEWPLLEVDGMQSEKC